MLRTISGATAIRIVLQTFHSVSFSWASNEVAPEAGWDETGSGASGRGGGRCHMDLVTITVVGIIVVSYLVGSLTSSVETEKKLPHRY